MHLFGEDGGRTFPSVGHGIDAQIDVGYHAKPVGDDGGNLRGRKRAFEFIGRDSYYRGELASVGCCRHHRDGWSDENRFEFSKTFHNAKFR